MAELQFMSQSEIEKAQAENKIEAMYDGWKNGTIPYHEYQEFMIKLLGNYIKKIIKRYNLQNYDGGGVEYADLLHSAILGIMLNLRKFDPRKGMATTFFTPIIIDSIKSGITTKDESKYYKYVVSQLNKAVQEFGFEDIHDPALKPQFLYRACGSKFQLSTIEEALKYEHNANVCSFEALTENNDLRDNNSLGKNPLSIVTEEETKSELAGILQEKLTSFERYLVDACWIGPATTGYRAIVIALKNDDFKAQFADDEVYEMTGVDKNYIEARLSNIKNRLMNNATVKRCAGSRRAKTIILEETDEQASYDDISAAYDCGDLF